jgi:hypothetical protein
MLTSLAAKLKAAGSSSIALRKCVVAGDARLTLPALVLVAFLSLLVSQSLGQRNGFLAKATKASIT